MIPFNGFNHGVAQLAKTDCSLSNIGVLVPVPSLQSQRDSLLNPRAAAYSQSTAKRYLDLIIAIVLLAVLAPLFLIVAAAIKISSNGPIIFTQARSGLGGAPFTIMKFRTMYTPAAGPYSSLNTRRGDPRVTKVGCFLRKTSIDELPQLWNVVQGEMSLVGPRPHACEQDKKYLTEHPEYRRRFDVKPGMTGLAQVRGSRGIIEDDEKLRVRLYFDLEYANSASLLFDLKIIAATINEVLFSRNAC